MTSELPLIIRLQHQMLIETVTANLDAVEKTLFYLKHRVEVAMLEVKSDRTVFTLLFKNWVIFLSKYWLSVNLILRLQYQMLIETVTANLDAVEKKLFYLNHRVEIAMLEVKSDRTVFTLLFKNDLKDMCIREQDLGNEHGNDFLSHICQLAVNKVTLEVSDYLVGWFTGGIIKKLQK